MTPQPWRSAVQFLLGVALVATAAGAVWLLRPRQQLPPGWQTITISGDVMAMVSYRDEMWAGGRDGLARIDPATGTVTERVQVDGAELRYVTALLVTREDELWVGHAGGASALAGGRWRTLTAAGLPATRVLALAEGADGALWIGTERGLARCAAAGCTVMSRQDGLASDTVSALFVDRHGTLWAGNGLTPEGGLSAWDGTSWRTFTAADGLAHPMINAFLEDAAGGLWAGAGFAARGGASRWDGAGWTTLTQDDGLAGGKVRSLFQDASGALWFGSEYDGVARYAEGRWLVWSEDDGLSGLEVKAMLQTPEGDLWLGTENGITRVSAAVLRDL